MLYPDTVVRDPLVRSPLFLLAFVGVVTALLGAVDLTNTIFGELLRPVIGEPADSGLFGRLAVAFVLALALLLNVVCPHRVVRFDC